MFTTFNTIGSPDIDSSNTHPRYVFCAFCFIFISLYLIFSLRIFLALCLLGKKIDLVLSSPKWTLNLLSTDQSQIFSKSSLSIFFDYCNVFMLVYKTWVISIQEKIWMYCLRHIIDIKQKQKGSQNGTPQEIFPKSDFWRSISIIPVSKPSSNSLNILSVKCAKHRFVEWFGLNPDWKLYKISFSERNLFVWLWTILLSITLEMIGSKEIGLWLEGSVFFPFL